MATLISDKYAAWEQEKAPEKGAVISHHNVLCTDRSLSVLL